MGRQKIPIKEIEDQRKKSVTFSKRKKGLYKKAMELSILTNSRVLLVVLDENDHLYEYSSNEDPRPLLRKYFEISNISHEKVSNSDYESIYGTGGPKRKRNNNIPLRSNPSMVHLDRSVAEHDDRRPRIDDLIDIPEFPQIPPIPETIEKKINREPVRSNNKNNNMRYTAERMIEIPPPVRINVSTPNNSRNRVPYQYTTSSGFTPLPDQLGNVDSGSQIPKKMYLGYNNNNNNNNNQHMNVRNEKDGYSYSTKGGSGEGLRIKVDSKVDDGRVEIDEVISPLTPIFDPTLDGEEK